jgi:hypothetical protein
VARQISDRPLSAMAVSPNGRILTILDGAAEHRLSAEKPTGPIRSLPLEANAGAGALDFGQGPPFEATTLAADPFNRYLISGHKGGLGFHPLFDTDWQLDLTELAAPVTAAAISPDARLWAVAMADGRLLVGLAPNGDKGTFLPVRRLEAGGISFLGFGEDNSSLLTVGQNGLALWTLDWNLTLPVPATWGKRAELVLGNFLVRRDRAIYGEELAEAFLGALAAAGLLGLDERVAKKRLKDAIDKRLEEE